MGSLIVKPQQKNNPYHDFYSYTKHRESERERETGRDAADSGETTGGYGGWRILAYRDTNRQAFWRPGHEKDRICLGTTTRHTFAVLTVLFFCYRKRKTIYKVLGDSV